MKSKATLLAVAGVMGLALPFLAATPASAQRVLQRCDYYNHNCVRVYCDNNDADRCWNESRYVRTGYYQHPGYWQCDGRRCWYKYTALHFGDDRDHGYGGDHDHDHDHGWHH